MKLVPSAFVASLIAPALTVTIFQTFDVVGGHTPDLGMFGKIYSVVVAAPLMGLFFGVPGAFLVLGPILVTAAVFRPTKSVLAFAGALSGVIYSAIGAMLVEVFGQAPNFVVLIVEFILGFEVFGGHLNWIAFAAATAVSGAVSGLVFARVYRAGSNHKLAGTPEIG